jgi:hypothetical protein
MADLNLNGFSTPVFTDKRRARGGTGADVVGTPANYATIATLKARLTAISATSYTVDRLNKMTKNDMVMAVRLNDDAAGVK